MHIIPVPFVRPTETGQTPTIPVWTPPFYKKKLIWEHVKQCHQYNECQNIDSALRNQLMTEFEDTYLSPLKHPFTGYFAIKMLQLILHLYDQYARISTIYLAANYANLREPFNPSNPLESLYMRLNECIDCATAAGEPITEGQVVRIAYAIIT